MLLADAGYTSYASVLVTSRKMVDEHRDVVQRFVDATIKGWLSYLNGDPAPAHALIKRENPDMNDEILHYGRTQLKEHGVVEGGDAKTAGAGVMTEARWKSFFELMSNAGLYPKDMDYKQAYTTEFVGHKGGN